MKNGWQAKERKNTLLKHVSIGLHIHKVILCFEQKIIYYQTVNLANEISVFF